MKTEMERKNNPVLKRRIFSYGFDHVSLQLEETDKETCSLCLIFTADQRSPIAMPCCFNLCQAFPGSDTYTYKKEVKISELTL